MLKFFTKYQKLILVVGGSILMVAFLVPSVDFLLPDMSVYTLGHVGGREVTSRDQQQAALEIDALQSVRASVAQFAQINRNAQLTQTLNMLAGAGFPDDPMTWLLIQHEARRHGIYSTQLEAEQVLLEMNSVGLDVSRIAAQAGGKDLLVSALQHWRMFLALAEMSFGSNPASEPRLRHFARDTRSQVKLQLVALDPQKIIEPTEPTDEQIVALFEKHRKEKAGESKPYGFGYMLPARVKFEYIAMPLQRVVDSIKVDEVEAVQYYQQNPTEFLPPPPPPVEPAPSTEPAPVEGGAADETPPDAPAEEAPAPPQEPPAPQGEPNAAQCQEEAAPAVEATEKTEPPAAAHAPDPSKPLPYKEARTEVLKKVAESKARPLQAEILKFIQAELQRDVAALPSDEKGYRKLEGHTPLSLEALAQQVQEKFGILPDVVKLDTWQSLQEISQLPGFGKASLEMPGRPLPVTTYIASLPALGLDKEGQLAGLKLQAGMASRTVADFDGNAYVFRITASDTEREPKELDEVRDKVVKDWKESHAYEELKARSDSLLERVKAEGLESLAKQYELKVEEAGPLGAYDDFMRQYTGQLISPTLPGVGRSPSFIQKAIELGEKVDAAGGPELAEPALTFGVIPADEARKVCLVKITGFTPIDSKTFDLLRPFFSQSLVQTEAGSAAGSNPLSLESLKKSVGFVEVGSQDSVDGHDHEGDHDHSHESDPG